MLKVLLLVIFSSAFLANSKVCSAETVPMIESGVYKLGQPLDAFAKSSYMITLKNNLGSSTVIHKAFGNFQVNEAISGFQASCSQSYYALSIDTAVIANSNTQMILAMNYQYDTWGQKYLTQWKKVKINYLLVSDQFASFSSPQSTSGGNYIWAGSVQFQVTKNGHYGVYSSDSIFGPLNDIETLACGYMKDANPIVFDTVCSYGDNIIPHFYIMGFQYAPRTYAIGASIKIENYLLGENFAKWGDSDANGWGPMMLIDHLDGGVKILKVSIVLTTLRDTANYQNNQNPSQSFRYSGMYSPIETKNKQVVMARRFPQPPQGAYNSQKYLISHLTYGIYGLSSFRFLSSALCAGETDFSINIQVLDFYRIILQTNLPELLSDVFISGDFYSPRLADCGVITPSRYLYDISEIAYSIIPRFKSSQQAVTQTSNSPPTFRLTASPASDQSTETIQYTVAMKFPNFIAGNAYIVVFELIPGGDWQHVFDNNVDNLFELRYSIHKRQYSLLKWTFTYDLKFKKAFIANFQTQLLTALLIIKRPIDPDLANDPTYQFVADLTVTISQYTTVYEPLTDCCLPQCPPNSDLTVGSPPKCVVCKNQLILYWSDQITTCKCFPKYYEAYQAEDQYRVCLPCTTKLCDECFSSNPSTCIICSAGAFLKPDKTCECAPGFSQSNYVCKPCPKKCSTCDPNGVCTACFNSLQKIETGCSCPADYFFDQINSACKPCNKLCQTCSNESGCTSCSVQKHRVLRGTACVCQNGFYEVQTMENIPQCLPCKPQCQTCILFASLCLSCRTDLNRSIGQDEMGHQTCLCPPGFQGLANGSCAQKGCSSDPFCSVCNPITNICSECLSSYKLQENKCVSSSKDDATIVIVTFVLGIVFLGAILILFIVFSLKHLKNLRNPMEESESQPQQSKSKFETMPQSLRQIKTGVEMNLN